MRTDRAPASSPDEKERFYSDNSTKFHENGSASSPSGVLTEMGHDESHDMLI